MRQILLAEDEDGLTFLHWAARVRSAAVFRFLLAEFPADLVLQIVSVRNKWSHTVLHQAAQNDKHEDVILCLLEYIYKQPGK